MDAFRLVSGWIILGLGIIGVFIGFFLPPLIIYGVIGIVLGILLLLNVGREDKIEKIKSRKVSGTNKHKKGKK